MIYDAGMRTAYNALMAAKPPPPIRRNFIAKWRKKKGNMTLEQLGDLVGVHKAQVGNWENHARGISAGSQRALARALDIGMNDIYRDPDIESADSLLRDADPQIVQEAIQIIKVLLSRGP